MRILLLSAVVGLALAGCASSSSGDDGTVKSGSGVAMNPGGKPQTPEDTARQSAMQQQGNAMNAQAMQAARDMAAAKAKTGGK